MSKPMTTERANALIVTALTVSSGLVVVREAADGDGAPPARFVIGVCLAGVALGVTAQLAPQLAGGLALLMLTTSVLVYGGPAFDVIGSSFGAAPGATTSGRPAGVPA